MQTVQLEYTFGQLVYHKIDQTQTPMMVVAIKLLPGITIYECANQYGVRNCYSYELTSEPDVLKQLEIKKRDN